MNANEESVETPQTDIVDRREFDRLPPKKEFVIVRTKSGTTTAGKVENISSGGIGLQLEFRVGIDAHDEVEVICEGGIRRAVVRYVKLHDDETMFAGLEWTDRSDNAT